MSVFHYRIERNSHMMPSPTRRNSCMESIERKGGTTVEIPHSQQFACCEQVCPKSQHHCSKRMYFGFFNNVIV